MEDVGARSARHPWQRRCEVGLDERYEVGCVGGELEGEVLFVLDVEYPEERRRRKGRARFGRK
jgi:hypothetical protein